VGADVAVDGPITVQNLGRIEIGDRVQLASRAAVSHLVTSPTGSIRIGHDVTIGAGAAVASHAGITIGPRTRVGAYAMFMDTDFHEVGQHSEGGGSTPIQIGADVTIGARVVVLRGTIIRDGAWIAPGSVVSGEVAAGARVGGVPARSLDAAGETIADGISMEALCGVVARTFGLSEPPLASTRRTDIARWDSLGLLNLLLSLETAFAVSLTADGISRVETVGDLLPIVANAPQQLDLA
jgi:maltose O-acetyltransferase